MGDRLHRGFGRARRGGALATFTGFEADLLRSLAAQLVELLRNEAAVPRDTQDPLEALLDLSGPSDPPEDPVLARLFPTAYTQDEEAAADFRRYTEPDLRNGKAGQATAMIESLERAGLPDEVEGEEVVELELDAEHAMLWLKGLTDLRLALAVRLGIEDDDDHAWEQLPEDDPRAHLLAIYDWLGFLQETLVRALS